jgi:hypothetical protein
MINHTFTLTTGSGTTVKGLKETPMLVLGVLSSGMGLGSQIAELDHQLGGVISSEISKRGFQGDLGKHFTLEIEQKGAPQNVLVLGLGSPDKFDRKAHHQGNEDCSRTCRQARLQQDYYPHSAQPADQHSQSARAGFYHPPGG